MTVDSEYIEDEPQTYSGPAIPVYIDPKFNDVEKISPDYGSTGTFVLQLAGQAQPVQVLQRRERRNKARVLVMSLGNMTAQELLIANPAAGSGWTYTNTSGLPQTLQSVQSFFTADATVANRFVSITAHDANNNVLWVVINGTAVVASSTLRINAFVGATQLNSASGTWTAPVPQVPIPPGGNIIVSSGTLGPGDTFTQNNITFIQSGVVAMFHNRPDILSLPTPPPNTGVQITTAPFAFDWESQQPLYGVGIGGTVQVSVIDESYADTQ